MILETTTGGEQDVDSVLPEASTEEPQTSPEEKALVSELTKWCVETRNFWKDTHKRMRDESRFAAGKQWPDETPTEPWEQNYVANFTRRAVNQKVASIYAKNPRTVCHIRPQQSFVVWDGEQASLEAARIASQDPALLQMALDQQDPKAAEALMKAQAILLDYENGMTRKEMLKRWGRTLELVYDHQCDVQQPNFKTQMKAVVRRSLTERVGWVKLAYRVDGGTVATESATEANTPERVKTAMQKLNDLAEGEVGNLDALKAEVKLLVESLQQGVQDGAEKLVDEGLVFDFPKATSIIPDKTCTSLKTFAGCNRVAQEFVLEPEEVERRYGVDVKAACTPYTQAGRDDTNRETNAWPNGSKVCVWEVYDKPTQMKYVVCDGYDAFLEKPEKPKPCISRFWPIFGLVFNEVEVEENDPTNDVTCYPPSDVRLLMPLQCEHNRSREALRKHRIANRPLYAGSPALTQNDRTILANGHPDNYVLTIEGLAAGQSVDALLQMVKKHPLDPAVYQTMHVETDVLLTIGAQQANLGPTSDATATEVSVAEGSRIQSGSSDIDDLDDFLSELCRAGGEMLQQMLSAEMARRIAGPGASWPSTKTEMYNSELFLESEAAGSGRPNRQLEVSNFQMMAPLLMQLPGINPEALAKEGIKRLDDRLSIEDFFQKDLPSIMAMNAGPGPVQAGAEMQQENNQPGAQPTQPGQPPPTANSPEKSLAEQAPTTQGMPAQFQKKTAASAAQPR
jgi:hypothetical protein